MISFFVQSVTNSNSDYYIILQANNASDVSVDLVVNYTDIYHHDISDYMSITFSLNLFAVDPPVFDGQLKPLNINRWTNFNINLPNIIDPNELKWTVSLGKSTPSWVKLSSNNLLSLYTSDSSLNIPEVMNITIRITNSQRAWTEYNQTIFSESLSLPSFSPQNNFTVNINSVTGFDFNTTGNFTIFVVDWLTNVTISWVWLDTANSKIIINSNLMPTPQQWIKLKSSDSWGNNIYSSNYYIYTYEENKSSITASNSFGPLIAFVGDQKLFKIPDDLFSSHNSFELSSKIIKWQVDKKVSSYLTKPDSSKGIFLFLTSQFPNSWILSIIASNVNSKVRNLKQSKFVDPSFLQQNLSDSYGGKSKFLDEENLFIFKSQSDQFHIQQIDNIKMRPRIAISDNYKNTNII